MFTLFFSFLKFFVRINLVCFLGFRLSRLSFSGLISSYFKRDSLNLTSTYSLK